MFFRLRAAAVVFMALASIEVFLLVKIDDGCVYYCSLRTVMGLLAACTDSNSTN